MITLESEEEIGKPPRPNPNQPTATTETGSGLETAAETGSGGSGQTTSGQDGNGDTNKPTGGNVHNYNKPKMSCVTKNF